MRNRLLFHSYRFVLAYAIPFLSILVLVSCAQSKSGRHASPFEAKKFHLSEKSIRPATDSTVAMTVEKLEMVAVIDNACVEEKCINNENQSDFSCRFYKNPDRRPLLPIQYYSFKVEKPASVANFEAWVEGDECVVGVANEYQYKSVAYNDPKYLSAQKAYLDNINFEDTQNFFTSENLSPVKVAVIDSPIATHAEFGGEAELPGVIWREDVRLASSRNDPSCAGITDTPALPHNWHGTFAASIIGAKQNNSVGGLGLARNAQLLGFRIGNCHGSSPTAEMGNAILAARAQGAEVVNISYGGATGDDIALRNAFIVALNSKMVVVVSAGNSSLNLSDHFYFPASYAPQYPGFITVGASLKNAIELAPFSNYGAEHIKITAPGKDVTALGYSQTGDNHGQSSGTSFSAPMVSAAAALTIGFLKKKKLQYDEQTIEILVTDKGARHVAALSSTIRNGAVLDFEQLKISLEFLLSTGANPAPINISGVSMGYDTSSKAAYINFNASWDVEAVHHGARLGLFDGTCGYSEPCRLQDYALGDTTGARSFRVGRNDTLPIISDLRDPEFGLFLQVAIYYQIPDPNRPGKFKNNYGIDAKASVDLRAFDNSTAASPFLGAVTNIRMDMQNMYVQGWACVEFNNKAVPIQLVDGSNAAITTDYAYSYPYMVPHGPPIDLYSYSHRGGPFVAQGMVVNQTGRSTYKAGTEANPADIFQCKVLTAMHGFDFAIPLSVVNAKKGTVFKVRATHPNIPATKILLKHPDGKDAFTFPEPNYQPSIPTTVAIARSGDTSTVQGNVCSSSPSPIHMEVSFSEWDLRCRMKEIAGFPNTTSDCQIGSYAPFPLMHNPNGADREEFHSYDQMWGAPTFTRTVDLEMTEEELAKHISDYPGRFPNAEVGYWAFWSSNNTIPSSSPFQTFIRNLGLQEVGTGAPLADIQYGYYDLNTMGTKLYELHPTYRQHRSNTSVRLESMYWDYIDVGEGYTPSVVAYELDTTKTIGDYIARNYGGVKKLMREVKKYETPLGATSHVVAHQVVAQGAAGGSGCAHRFTFNQPITELIKRQPRANAYLRAALKQGESRLAEWAVDPMNTVISEVPFDLRFFQDGVMILHLVSNFGTQTFPVPTLGRTGGP